MNENKVYVVTSGEYSDYEVKGVFSTKGKALDFIDNNEIYGYSSFTQLEIYTLDSTSNIKRVKNNFGMIPFKLGCISKEGIIKNQECEVYDLFKFTEIPFYGFRCFYQNTWLEWLFPIDYSDEKIRKILPEKLTQILAQNLWNKTEECEKLFRQPLKLEGIQK